MTTPDRPPYEVIAWADGRVRLLDQTLLPAEQRTIDIATPEAMAEAIATMRIRGAPAIGIAGAYGLALAARAAPRGGVRSAVATTAARLLATRPTAVNLRWALEHVATACVDASDDEAARDAALAEARRVHAHAFDVDRRSADAGAALIAPGSRVLTHCNTGPLATGGYGSALGVVIAAHRAGRVASVLVDETRPRLQGARLTAWELAQHGVDCAVIADGAAAALMAAGEVDAVLVGADRIAANGDTANKIGTYGLAIAARHHAIPFYVVAPLGTVDLRAPTGAAIPIEERAEDEVLGLAGTRVAPSGARARNPAFDVTPAALITAIVTEAGVLRAPYDRALADVLGPD